eukprot:TRINITY_DN60728_c0_g1_i1.p1 TRINITY_DN60728_c0_g1~~TRINITY_DN60728_c0_g1_i1.p1  ORF type:complete len:291 (-),score=48.93 TRINITY_DN60728_c0_g1_i1:343-1215(-)
MSGTPHRVVAHVGDGSDGRAAASGGSCAGTNTLPHHTVPPSPSPFLAGSKPSTSPMTPRSVVQHLRRPRTSMQQSALPPLRPSRPGSARGRTLAAHEDVATYCKPGCCWHWLTAMVLQEVQGLKRSVIEIRDEFADQERALVNLEQVDNWDGFESLTALVQDLQTERDDLFTELPALEGECDRLRKELKSSKLFVQHVEANVDQLRTELRAQHESRSSLSSRLGAAELEISRTESIVAPLAAELKNLQDQVNEQKAIVEKAFDAHDKCKSKLDAKAKKMAKKSKRKPKKQ